MTSTDKAKVNNATEAAATIDAGKVVMGASDGSRSVREASDADLDSLAGDLASGDRGANELALKSELPTGGGGGSPTNLSVSRTGTQVTVASSTGTDAVLPAASTTQAGVMTVDGQERIEQLGPVNGDVRRREALDGGDGQHPQHPASDDWRPEQPRQRPRRRRTRSERARLEVRARLRRRWWRRSHEPVRNPRCQSGYGRIEHRHGCVSPGGLDDRSGLS